MNLENKTILITGANGLVGIPTIQQCLLKNPKKVIVVDKNTNNLLLYKDDPRVKIVCTDLTYFDRCEKLFEDDQVNFVFHLAGIKGSPSRTAKSPADYMFPMLMFNTNIMKAAFDARVDWFVYMSSVGVYAPADIMYEDSVWTTMPSKNDWHPGWAKRIGELSLDALRIQYGWKNWSVIRPSNIYGPYDNFSEDATVIAANVWKVFNTTEDKIVCWGDGSPKRDFVFSEDVAQSVIGVVEKEVNDIINFGSGQAVTIKETIETIVKNYKIVSGKDISIEWDVTKPTGDMLRCLSHLKQQEYNILPSVSLNNGIMKTINRYNLLGESK